MRFGRALHRLLDIIMEADPQLGPYFLSKVDLADQYIQILVRINDIPSVYLLTPKDRKEEEQLVGFHLSTPIGYV